MATEAVLPGEGFAAGVAQAIEAAGPLLPLRDAEQLDMLRDRFGRVDGGQVGQAERSRGRPKGAGNKRTSDVRDYLLSRYAHPLEVLAQIISRPIDALVAELGCKPVEALALVKSAAAELAPYIESKLPVAIDVRTRRDVVLLIPGVNAPLLGVEELGEMVERDGIEGIDWSQARTGQVIEHAPLSSDADQPMERP